MKKIFTLIASAFLATMTFAQTDIKIETVYSDDISVRGLGYSAWVSLGNNGPDSIPADSVLPVGMFINGTIVDVASIGFENPIPSGFSSGLIRFGAPAGFMDTVTVTNDTLLVCFQVVPYATANDTDLTNNILCYEIEFDETPAISIGASDLQLFADGSEISTTVENNKTIDSAYVTIENKGTDIVPFGASWEFNLSEGSNSTGTFSAVNTASNFSNGAAVTYIIAEATEIAKISLPTSTGNYEYCATANVTVDNNSSDDTFCKTITVEFPNSISETNKSKLQIISSNDQIIINEAKIGSAITVTNISGQVMLNSTINSSTKLINTSNFVNGIYFITVGNTSKKVIIQK